MNLMVKKIFAYFVCLTLFLSLTMNGYANLTSGYGIAEIMYNSGRVFYFSSYNGTDGTNSMAEIAAGISDYLDTGTCTSLNPTGIDAEDLTSTTRFIAFRGNIIKMVVYVWV